MLHPISEHILNLNLKSLSKSVVNQTHKPQKALLLCLADYITHILVCFHHYCFIFHSFPQKATGQTGNISSGEDDISRATAAVFSGLQRIKL